jgi:hypothetical protein
VAYPSIREMTPAQLREDAKHAEDIGWDAMAASLRYEADMRECDQRDADTP